MFIIKILLGQSTNEINYARLLTRAWVLTGIFLSDNYQENNIDQLTSSMQLNKYETFDQILGNNLTLYLLPLRHELLQPYIIHPDGPTTFFADWKRY